MLTTDLEVGGVPLHVCRLAVGLKERRWGVSVACLAPPGPVADMIRTHRIDVDALGARGPWDARCLWRLARCLRTRKPALLHSFLFHANQAARLVGPAAGVHGRRIVCEIQTVERDKRWHLRVDNLTCRLSAVEVGNSAGVVEHLARCAHVPRERLRVIYGGVDVERFASATPVSRESLGTSAGEMLWLWIGRLDPVKGLDVLLQALASCSSERPWRLLLVGEGPYRPVVEDKVSELRLGDRVRLLGRRDDVPALLAAADAFVFPSLTEGFPNALLEAMAAGRACVASDVAGCNELLSDGVSGLLVPPGDAAALGRAMATLAGDAGLRIRLGRRARERVGRDFTMQACIQRRIILYEELLGWPGPTCG